MMCKKCGSTIETEQGICSRCAASNVNDSEKKTKKKISFKTSILAFIGAAIILHILSFILNEMP